MNNAVVGLVIAILVAASLGAGYLIGNSARSTESMTSTSTSIFTSLQTITSTSTVSVSVVPGSQVTTSDSNSSLGIALILALNATTIKQGQDLPNTVKVLNTLPRVNNVSAGSGFPVKPFSPPCNRNPIDVEMYSGYYDSSNISGASPLPYIRTCPAVSSTSLVTAEYYLFQPSSTNATLYGLTLSGKPSSSGSISFDLVNQTSVYQFMSSFPIGVHPVFPAGVYTLMVQDSWGQMVILHFSVVP